MKKYKIGYTQGTFDLFHIGHLNILKKSKELCDYLIVGVNSDDLVRDYKNKNAIISEKDRLEIIKSIKYVDDAFLVNTLDKKEILKNHEFNVILIGDDWKRSKRWQETKKEFHKLHIDVIFLPYTQGISSSIIRKELNNEKN